MILPCGHKKPEPRCPFCRKAGGSGQALTTPGRAIIKAPCPGCLGVEEWGPEGPPEAAAARRGIELDVAAAMAAQPPPAGGGRGIVTCAGGPRYFPCAYVLLSLLRRLGCVLPVEVWHLGPDEMDPSTRALLEEFGGVAVIDAVAVAAGLAVRPKHLGGWEAKVFALLHTRFDEALFLDADQVPAADPTYLFDAQAYRAAGTILWPDKTNQLGTDIEAEAFRACGLPVPGRRRFRGRHPTRPTDYRPVESGQVLVDRRRRWAELTLAGRLADRADYFYGQVKGAAPVNLIYGDKSLFALAWWRVAKERGELRPYLGAQANYFMPRDCTWVGDNSAGAFLQHDPAGRVVFQHRCQPPTKYNLTGPNKDCGLAHWPAVLAALDSLKKRWGGGGQTPDDPAPTLAGRDYLFLRNGGMTRFMLRPDGVAEGLPAVTRWSAGREGGEPRLRLALPSGPVALGPGPLGEWQNQGAGVVVVEAPPPGWALRDRFDAEVWYSVARANEYDLPARFDAGDVILDIGGHVGSFALTCLERGAGAVVSVEANPDNYPILAANLAAHPGRARAVFGAAWRSDRPAGTVAIRLEADGHLGGGSVVGACGGREVPTVPFDALVDEATAGGRPVRLLKIDCEGAEWPILWTSRRLDRVTEIVGEYHLGPVPGMGPEAIADGPPYTPDGLRAVLEGAGFAVTFTPHPGAVGLGWFRATRHDGSGE